MQALIVDFFFRRLCIVFLTFSCLGYAMPFILCATICLLLPCIALMGFVDEPMTGRGASKVSSPLIV